MNSTITLDHDGHPLSLPAGVFGLRLIEDDAAMVSYWEFPKEPFVEYEPKDEPWCRHFGIGCQKSRPGAYQIGDTILIHPVAMRAVERFTKRLEDGRQRLMDKLFEFPIDEAHYETPAGYGTYR